MNKKVIFQDLGVIDYKKAWNYQEDLFSQIIETKSINRKTKSNIPTKNHLLFCEHNHVYTLGKSGEESNLLLEEKRLVSRGAKFYRVNRGGDITYHGPGQIVGYPILDLENFFTDIGKYLRLLEEAVILTLQEYGVQGMRSKGETGVWIEAGSINARKICAIGVKSSRWVCMHGFAFNINTDLSYFNDIVPCGIQDKKVTSLKEEISETILLQEAKEKLKNHIITLFQMELIVK